MSLLVSVGQTPGVGVRELAVREGVSAAAMSRHVAKLVAAGLVTRRADPRGDRRRVGLELTDEAVRVLRLVRSRRTAWLAAGLRSLDEDDLAAVEAAVAPLRALLEARR